MMRKSMAMLGISIFSACIAMTSGCGTQLQSTKQVKTASKTVKTTSTKVSSDKTSTSEVISNSSKPKILNGVSNNRIVGFTPVDPPDSDTKTYLTAVAKSFEDTNYINQKQAIFFPIENGYIDLKLDGFTFYMMPTTVSYGDLNNSYNGTSWSYMVGKIQQPSSITKQSVEQLVNDFEQDFPFFVDSAYNAGLNNGNTISEDPNTSNDSESVQISLENPEGNTAILGQGIGWQFNGTTATNFSDVDAGLYNWFMGLINSEKLSIPTN